MSEQCAKTVQKKLATAFRNRPKPQMRGLHIAQCLKNIYSAVACSAVATILFYVFHNKSRQKIYEEFYINYDPMKSFQRMSDGGYLVSAPAGGGENQEECKKEEEPKKK